IGREVVRLHRERERLVGIRILERLGLCRENDGATAVGDGLLEMAVALAGGERVECACPVRSPALQLEKRIDRPSELRIEPQRALRDLARCLVLAFALGLEEEAAQAELLGFPRPEHGFENTP